MYVLLTELNNLRRKSPRQFEKAKDTPVEVVCREDRKFPLIPGEKGPYYSIGVGIEGVIPLRTLHFLPPGSYKNIEALMGPDIALMQKQGFKNIIYNGAPLNGQFK
ncbi:MAG TPA: hypothetical protein VJI46_02115 [Candidatus Nanoarchaeia archaeon]|nr:hypothetical protein [Candidatus Nanoarchaeia archaeon]